MRYVFEQEIEDVAKHLLEIKRFMADKNMTGKQIRLRKPDLLIIPTGEKGHITGLALLFTTYGINFSVIFFRKGNKSQKPTCMAITNNLVRDSVKDIDNVQITHQHIAVEQIFIFKLLLLIL